MTIRQQAEKLYNDTFGSDERFDKLLFDGFFDRCRYITEDDRLVSMLFELPVKIDFGQAVLPARYIYAAATRPDCRGKGYMSKLLRECRERPGIIILRPADSGLIEYYKRSGYLPFDAVARDSGVPFVTVPTAVHDMAQGGDTSGERFVMMCNGCGPSMLDGLGFAYSME